MSGRRAEGSAVFGGTAPFASRAAHALVRQCNLGSSLLIEQDRALATEWIDAWNASRIEQIGAPRRYRVAARAGMMAQPLRVTTRQQGRKRCVS